MTKLAPAAIAALAVFALAGAAKAQDVRALAPGAAPATATLADLKGLIGNWEGPGGAAGFSMTPDGQIVGHLEVSTAGKPRVEELWIFRPDGKSVSLSQKHFGPNYEAREDKDVWAHRKLVGVDSKGVYLENLTWLTGGDTLTLLVRFPAAPGAPPPVVTPNVMKRVK